MSEGPWECFHCGEVCTTREQAVDHFGDGNYEREEPICIEAATIEMKDLVRSNREMWTHLQKTQDALEQAEYERDGYKHTAAKLDDFEQVKGRALAAEAALGAGPRWLAQLLRWNSERLWKRERRRAQRLGDAARKLTKEYAK